MRRLLVVIVLVAPVSCKLKEARDFFQARPVDANTAIKIETVPKLGPAAVGSVPGVIEIDGVKVSDKTPFISKGIMPGPHQIRVSAKGYVGQEMEIDAKEGQVTPLSLALQSLAATKTAGSGGAHGGGGSGSKKKGAAEVASTDFSTHVVILTATPAVSVAVDGAAVGTSTGLHMHLDRATGEIVLGGLVSLTYFNRGNRVSVRPNVDSKSTLAIDGEASTSNKGKSFELDERPRRLEITEIGGARQVVLLKLAE